MIPRVIVLHPSDNLARLLDPGKEGESCILQGGRIWRGHVAAGRALRGLFACRYDVEDRLEAIGTHTLWHDASTRGRVAVMAKFQAVFPKLEGLKAAEYRDGTTCCPPPTAYLRIAHIFGI
jgi:hypothetical protein